MANSTARKVGKWLAIVAVIYLVGVGAAALSMRTHSAAGLVVIVVAGLVGLALLIVSRTRRRPPAS